MKNYRVINRKTGHHEWWCKNGFDDTPHVDFYLEDARRMFGCKAAYRIEEWEKGVLINPDVDPPSQEDIEECERFDAVMEKVDKETDGMDVFEKMAAYSRAIFEDIHRREYLKLSKRS